MNTRRDLQRLLVKQASLPATPMQAAKPVVPPKVAPARRKAPDPAAVAAARARTRDAGYDTNSLFSANAVSRATDWIDGLGNKITSTADKLLPAANVVSSRLPERGNVEDTWLDKRTALMPWSARQMIGTVGDIIPGIPRAIFEGARNGLNNWGEAGNAAFSGRFGDAAGHAAHGTAGLLSAVPAYSAARAVSAPIARRIAGTGAQRVAKGMTAGQVAALSTGANVGATVAPEPTAPVVAPSTPAATAAAPSISTGQGFDRNSITPYLQYLPMLAQMFGGNAQTPAQNMIPARPSHLDMLAYRSPFA